MPDITINFKGSSIATMSASGTETLLTEGKYCEDDIEIVYVKPSGGGGYSVDEIASCDAGSSKAITLTVSTIKDYAFSEWNITSVSGSSVTDIGNGAFRNCTSLASVDLPNLETNNSYGPKNVFESCTSLQNLYLPKLKSLGQYAFSKAGTSTGAIVLPAATSIPAYYFSNAYVKAIDIGSGVITFGNRALEKMPNIEILVLRRDGVLSIPTIQSVEGSRLASNGAGATLYVPNDQITSYQSASNWSTILGYANNQIKSIESTHTDPTAPIDLTLYYVDGTPIS